MRDKLVDKLTADILSLQTIIEEMRLPQKGKTRHQDNNVERVCNGKINTLRDILKFVEDNNCESV